MRRGSSTALLCAVAAGAGFLAGWLLRPAPRERVVVREVEVPSAHPPGPGTGSAPPVPAAPVPSAPPPAPSPGAGSAPAVAEAAPLPPRPAEVRVLVRDAAGDPVTGGEVYALGAGEPGADDGDDVAHRGLGADGSALLRLPWPGTYDIGYRSDARTALLPDVRLGAEPSAPVVLDLPGGDPIHFVLDPPWPPPGKGLGLLVRISTGDAPGARHYPGRGQTGRTGMTFAAGPEGSAESPPVPAGIPFRVTVDVLEWIPVPGSDARRASSPRYRLDAVPERARAGETVHLRLRETATAGVHLRAAPGEFEGRKSLKVRVDFLQGGRIQSGSCSAGGAYLAGRPLAALRFEGRDGPAALRWSGPGVRAGSLEDLHLLGGEFNEWAVVLHGDPAGVYAPRPAESDAAAADAPSPAVVVDGAGDGSETFVYRDADGDGEVLRAGAEAGLPRTLGEEWGGGRLYAIAPPFLAGGPVEVPAAGTVRVALRPAGLLLVAPDRVWSREFGSLRLRLGDGRPIPVCSDEGEGLDDLLVTAPARTGTLLGPFPEGTYAFEVRLGGVRLPDATATVRAGRIEVLRIRTRRE